MSEQGGEDLGLAWLDKLVEHYQDEPMYEEPRWNGIMDAKTPAGIPVRAYAKAEL